MKILFFDTETTGLPIDWNAPISDLNNWPRLVQIAWQVYDVNGNLLGEHEYIIKPVGFTIPPKASAVHKITTEKALDAGLDLLTILTVFLSSVKSSDLIVAHNYRYDYNVMGSELLRNGLENVLKEKEHICTMNASTDFCKISGPYGYKWPKLEELYKILFNDSFNAHNALDDIRATARCFWELENKNIIDPPINNDRKRHNLNKIFFESNDWDSIQIIVREIESGIEKINHSIERDLIYKYFHLNEYLHKFYESSPVKHWFSITEQLKFDSEGWDMPGNFDGGKYTGYDLNWIESVNLEIPKDLHYDEMHLHLHNWISDQIHKLPVRDDWVLIGTETNGDFNYGCNSPNTKASYYFLSKEKLNKYFENLSKDEIDKLIENIINETSYKIFNFLRGGRTWNTFEETENIRSFPENYDYYFAIKDKNHEILSTNFKFNDVETIKKEKAS